MTETQTAVASDDDRSAWSPSSPEAARPFSDPEASAARASAEPMQMYVDARGEVPGRTGR